MTSPAAAKQIIAAERQRIKAIVDTTGSDQRLLPLALKLATKSDIPAEDARRLINAERGRLPKLETRCHTDFHFRMVAMGNPRVAVDVPDGSDDPAAEIKNMVGLFRGYATPQKGKIE